MTNLYYWPFEYGAKSKANKELQRRLGFSAIDADGIFGRETRNVLLMFQKNNGLPQSGEVDRATEDKLFPGNFERRTPSMNINSNWLSGIVATTGFKYVLTMIATYLAAKLGVDQGTLVGIITQALGVVLGLWGMWEASKSKIVVDGTRVEVKDLPIAEQAKVAAVVEKATNAKA